MFHLRTLGGLALDRDGAPLDGAPRKALALLAVIAASPTKGVGRDRVMALLWPESDTERARGTLKQTIHVLRQQLGSPDALVGTDELRLNPAIITSDVGSFLDALLEGDAEGAVRHYTGAFLDGVHIETSSEFQRWSDETRAELARRRAESIEQLAVAAEKKGDHVAAARWWQRLQAIDPLSGRIALRLMRALDAAGDRAAALRHARVHAQLLQQEVGVPPDREVAALAERLASAPAHQPLPAAPVTAPVPDAAPAEPARAATVAPAAPLRRGLMLSVGAAAIVAIMLVVLFSERPPARSSGTADLDPKRVAVGIFENETGDSLLAPLGKMAADWVVRGLARTGVVHVLDAATLYVQPNVGSREGALDFARRNGAGLAVAGRFYRERDSLVFTAAVFDVASGRVLHTLDPVRATPNEALPAVEELRQRLAATLVAEVDPRATSMLRGPVGRPPTYDAYREFVFAHELYWRGRVDEGVAGFRRAATLDTTFQAAIMWLITSAVTLDRCDLADSVIQEWERRKVRFSAGDDLVLRARRSRCNRDWDQGVEDQRARIAAEPGSTIPRWALAANLRRANRPAEAVVVLRALNPGRDLGWMSDDGKVMYWREVAWSHHMLGDSAGQQQTVAELQRMAPERLATAYFASLAHVSAGRLADAVRALEGVESLAADPPIVAGEIAGRTPPAHLGTPAWVLYQVGTELLSIGDSADAVALARRAGRWIESRSSQEQSRVAAKYLRVLALELEGRVDSAQLLATQLARDEPTNIEVRGRSGVLAARRGERAEAMAVDAWLARQPAMLPPGIPQLERARIAAVLGDIDRAIQLIETLPFRAHPVDVVFFHSDPAFASLRSDPRWTRFLKPRG